MWILCMTSSSLVKIIRSPFTSDAALWVNTIPCCPTEIVAAACTATMIPIRKATAAARRRGMTIPAWKSGRSERLEFRGGLETEKEAIVAAGVDGAAVEAEIAHILRDQPQVYIRIRRIRLAPGHVGDFENHAVRVGAAIGGGPVFEVGRAGGAKILDRWRDGGREAVGDVDAHRVQQMIKQHTF